METGKVITSNKKLEKLQEKLEWNYEVDEHLPIGTMRILKTEVLQGRRLASLSDVEFMERLNQAITIARFRQNNKI